MALIPDGNYQTDTFRTYTTPRGLYKYRVQFFEGKWFLPPSDGWEVKYWLDRPKNGGTKTMINPKGKPEGISRFESLEEAEAAILAFDERMWLAKRGTE